MIYYDQKKQEFVIDAMVIVHDVGVGPAIIWNESDPKIRVSNNVFITMSPETVSSAWWSTKYLLGIIWRVWASLRRSDMRPK